MVPSKEPEVTPVTKLIRRSTVKLPVAPANRPVPFEVSRQTMGRVVTTRAVFLQTLHHDPIEITAS
jgi:hypothetical protein